MKIFPLILAAPLCAAVPSMDCEKGMRQFEESGFFRKTPVARQMALITQRDRLVPDGSEYVKRNGEAYCFLQAFGWRLLEAEVPSEFWLKWPDSKFQMFPPGERQKHAWKSRLGPVAERLGASAVYESVHDNPVAAQDYQRLSASLPCDRAYGEPQLREGFSSGAITLKAIWRLVPTGKSISLGIWPSAEAFRNPADIREERRWPICVNVIDSNQPPRGQATCGKDAQGREVKGDYVSANSLLTYRLPARGSAIHFVSLTKGAPPPANGIMILVGVHMASRHIPDWTWSTFWYQPRTQTTEQLWKAFAQGRPENLKGWANFVGGTSASFNHPATTLAGAVNTCGSCATCKPDCVRSGCCSNVLFNPYLEALTLENGAKSSCMSCHSQAAWDDKNLPILPIGTHTVKRLEGLVRTDYSWRLASQMNTSACTVGVRRR